MNLSSVAASILDPAFPLHCQTLFSYGTVVRAKTARHRDSLELLAGSSELRRIARGLPAVDHVESGRGTMMQDATSELTAEGIVSNPTLVRRSTGPDKFL
jgi:hypothetical protein